MSKSFNMCPFENCTVWFYNPTDLKTHIKLDHKNEKIVDVKEMEK